ncbi:MAG TPA: substrate-binding domain-containing protein [Luteolibacter sp.]|nr:substrate-binding domain-containing protein [Luteolibacter sp.]
MKQFKPLSTTEQVVEHIRQAMVAGELRGNMPGIRKLAQTLEVSANTVVAAVEQLEKKGFLVPQGHGRRSRIVLPEHLARQAFRVSLLPYERADIQLDYAMEIQQRLREQGYIVHIAEKSLLEMQLKAEEVSRMASNSKTDAWVVFSSTQDILEWFASQPVPTFALFGRFRKVPIAGIGLDKVSAFRAAVRRLMELGHRRIVLLQPKHNREPVPALLIRETLQEMAANGIPVSSYNIPDWEQSPDGLWRRLDALFETDPPTALILDRPNELIATQSYLAQRGIFAPRDVSLISDDDPLLEWCEPSVSCIQWKRQPWVNRVIRWVGNVAQGKDDRRQSFSKARYIERESVGPAQLPTPA